LEGEVRLERFSPKDFVETQIKELRREIGKEKALVAVSGGVDSTACAVLMYRAVGENLVCVILDDAFMREGEPEYVARTLSRPPLNVPIKIVDVRKRFMDAMKGLTDAEEKRKRFRETFYQVLGETARSEGCRILIQGTIRADIDETVGGVKTQHNVLKQIGIDPMKNYGFKVVEPLITLYKERVRIVSRFLGVPAEFSERQPFPGPGLSVRVVGSIHPSKLETVKKATAIVERGLMQHKPSQFFAVILENKEALKHSGVIKIQETVARVLNVPSRNVNVKIFRDRATGVKGGERRYGEIAGIRVEKTDGAVHHPPIQKLVSLQTRIITEDPVVARVFYAVKCSDEEKPYVIGIRAVQTKNFLTANVSEVPWKTLDRISEKVTRECKSISQVYYDVTPKPPATIEME